MSDKIKLTRAQADYLAKLKADADAAVAIAERALDVFQSTMNGIALATSDKGQIRYDFGSEPFVEVTPEEK